MNGAHKNKKGEKAKLDILMSDSEAEVPKCSQLLQSPAYRAAEPIGFSDDLERGHTEAKSTMDHTTDPMFGQV